MKLETFISKVAKQESKRVSVSVGNVREVVRIINKLTGGVLYALIKLLPE